MFKIGIIDDTDELLEDYVKRLKRNDIELLIAPEGNMEAVKEWIVHSHIKCILIDYQLSDRYDFNGTQLAFYLDDALQGFPYLILTSYPEDSVDEKLVTENCIIDRSVMDRAADDFQRFCDQLKQITEVFDNVMRKYKEKFKNLMDKKQKGSLSAAEEEEFMDVYRILKSYHEVDEIPAEMLKSSLSGQIDAVLEKLDSLLKD